MNPRRLRVELAVSSEKTGALGPQESAEAVWDSIVVGAGQAGLAASRFLLRKGIRHAVLDAEPGPGGAWRNRWDSLSMADVHGVADLPGLAAPKASAEPANRVLPAYFEEYERRFGLPVERPVTVRRVEDEQGLLRVTSADAEGRESSRLTRTLVNATGTWRGPFVPAVPGAAEFRGEQFHTVSYPGPEALRGKRVAVVGGGASAVQFLGELAEGSDLLWITRRPPQWRSGPVDGLAVVSRIEAHVVRGLPPESIVSETGIGLRPAEEAARRSGVFERRLPMFRRITPNGLQWADGREERVDAILWATGFRPVLGHLAPLGLRTPEGGIELRREPGLVQGATTSVRDPRISLVGYGPSASTIGAGRAGRRAAVSVERFLAGEGSAPPPAREA